MNVSVTALGIPDAIAKLRKLGIDTTEAIEKAANVTGTHAVRKMKSYREGGMGRNDKERTIARSRHLLRSYDYKVNSLGRYLELTIGPISPKDGKVLEYAGVHEGINAAGNMVSSTTITPKRAHQVNYVTRTGKAVSFSIKALHFPLRRGAGMAQANIVGWQFAKKVTIPARPALFKVAPEIPKMLEKDILDEFDKALAKWGT